jgi:photosystem II stability/assembly factor-like uncharacterized protein
LRPLRSALCVLACLALLLASAPAPPLAAQTAEPGLVEPGLLSHLRWRMIGPFRGGRTVAAVGVPGEPDLFYIGVNNGGVWKTTDAGRTWVPIFDREPTQSIGAIAVAPSNPKILYVGSGEGLQRPDLSVGDGVYRSDDGGATWRHLGLAGAQQIPALLVDPRDPERVFAAALGHPYGPNPERGVFRSTDGGRTWAKVLYKDEDTGAVDLDFDPADPRTVYAVLWSGRQAPWEIGSSWNGPGSGLYKSSDGGATWRPVTAGLPTYAQGLGRIGLSVAPSRPERLYAVVDGDAEHGGLYRSEDRGESWRRINGDPRLWGRGSDFAEVQVDPKDPDLVYVCNIAMYRSTDGGRSFTAFKGAPGGDDYHRLWIDPDRPRVLLVASDQGAVVSVNGGETWSSWYNQPTAQLYHVATDDRFPYRVYGGQQESGSVGISSRGDDGEITFREWHPVGAEEYGYIAPDPLHPDIVFGGKLQRFNWATGDVQDVSPEPVRAGAVRYVRTLPLVFSPADPRVLFFGASVLFKTLDGGRSWQQISPDLTREKPEVPANLGSFTALDPQHGAHRGVIYALAPSPLDADLLWAGTDDGLIHRTRDGGGHWQDVTPPALTPWSKVSVLAASPFDKQTAYAAINRFRLDDLAPHVYRTHDGGATWQEIVRGIPGNEVVNAVREDPVRRGLLFAGTERGVHVSFDDGEHWQSLRLNLPATAVRDLVVHGDDLVAGTHGRSFWILDNISTLRQLGAQAPAGEVHLFRPAVAYRVRRDRNTDTPLPPDEPAGENPPDGAMIDYFLKSAASGPLVLEVLDAGGRTVRRFASTDVPEPVDADKLALPTTWIRPPQVLATGPGLHRFVWDLHEAPPDALDRQFPISAIVHDTPRGPLGPAVLPGEYQVRLTAGGRTLTQPLTVAMDPRVKTPPAGLARQHELAVGVAEAMGKDAAALRQVRALRESLKSLPETKALPEAARQGDLGKQVEMLDAQLAALAEGDPQEKGPSLAGLNGDLAQLLEVIEGTDEPPTTQGEKAYQDLQGQLAGLLERWKNLRDKGAAALDARLRQAGLPGLLATR